MFIQRADSLTLTGRLDPSFYSPKGLDANAKILNFGNSYALKDLVDSNRKITNGVRGPELTDSSYKLVRLQDCNQWFVELDKCLTISKDQFNENRRCRLKKNDIVVAIGGYVGNASIVKDDTTAVIGQHSAMLSSNPALFDSYYLLAYLNTSVAEDTFQRYVSGTVQAGINLEDLREIPVPLPKSMSAQTYIGNKVRQAELLRERCDEIDSELTNEMLGLFAGVSKPKDKAFKRLPANVLTQNRLDPDFYSLVSKWSASEIKNGPNDYFSLGELTTRIKDGPGGWGVSTNDYRPHGIPVIRSVNIINGECDLTNSVYISEEKHQELIGHEAKKGSVVLSVRGTVGRAAVFEDDVVNSASLNAAVVTIDCKKALNPYYLAAFFNSAVGNTQANRIANGAVQLNMNLTETASNLIPLPPIDVQEKIEGIYRKLISARKINRMLVKASKYLVEALIEGKVTETEIIAAQQALENDDNTKDKAILCKITDKGYAAKDGKPLFSDLDALYDLLDEAELSQEEASQEEKEQG